MSFINNYTPAESLPKFDCSDGLHRVKITETRFGTSRNNKQFLAISLKVEGAQLPFVYKIYEGNGFDYTMTQFFDNFRIPRGNFDFASWNGKIANALFSHSERTVDGRVYRNAEIQQFSPISAPNPQNQSQNPPNFAQNYPQNYPQTQQSAEHYPF